MRRATARGVATGWPTARGVVAERTAPRLVPALRLVTALCLVTALAAGCGKDTSMTPTITLAQAMERVERILREAADQLPPGAELHKHGSDDPIPCEGPGGVDSGRVFAEREYQVVHPDSWPADQVLEILDGYWRSRGYRLRRDDRDAADVSELFVTDATDGTGVGVQLYHRPGGRIDAYLVGSTPCLWEFGTPAGDD